VYYFLFGNYRRNKKGQFCSIQFNNADILLFQKLIDIASICPMSKTVLRIYPYPEKPIQEIQYRSTSSFLGDKPKPIDPKKTDQPYRKPTQILEK
jgi:hypothetical protein